MAEESVLEKEMTPEGKQECHKKSKSKYNGQTLLR
jgi:hypothetical protein